MSFDQLPSCVKLKPFDLLARQSAYASADLTNSRSALTDSGAVLEMAGDTAMRFESRRPQPIMVGDDGCRQRYAASRLVR